MSVGPRETARRAGELTYQGKACAQGHTTRRVIDNKCAECNRGPAWKGGVDNRVAREVL